MGEHKAMNIQLIFVGLFHLELIRGIQTTSDYNEYQYDEPNDEFDDDVSENELIANRKLSIVTEPLIVKAIAGDKIILPCSADVQLDSVEIIWERPDVKQIVSIGDKLIKSDSPQEFMIEATERGNNLIIEAGNNKHEGQYKCKLATKNSIEVTHRVSIKLPDPKHQPLESGSNRVVVNVLSMITSLQLVSLYRKKFTLN